MNRADPKKEILVICGPTASGKSEYAYNLALKTELHGSSASDGIPKPACIINCDSMQVYKQIPIITASPAELYKSRIQHALYNFLNIDRDFSVAEYIRLTAAQIKTLDAKRVYPIIVAGTGMYLSALMRGIAYIPEINPDIRIHVQQKLEQNGIGKLYTMLKQYDPLSAQCLNPQDTQRVQRALAVFLQTGKSLITYQRGEHFIPLDEFKFKVIMLLPERNLLYEMCDKRLHTMFTNGAIEEIEEILQSDIKFGSSSIRALGVPEIIEYIRGTKTKAEALASATLRTRQYAKRQITWFKNQIPEKEIICFQSIAEYTQLLESLW